MPNCFAGRDQMEMLTLALKCTYFTQSLAEFVEEGKAREFARKMRKAAALFRKNSRSKLTCAQSRVFDQVRERHGAIHGELLILLNWRFTIKRRKQAATRAFEFFYELQGECLFHFENNTQFGPPPTLLKMLG